MSDSPPQPKSRHVAFHEFYQKNLPRITRFVRARTFNGDDALDLVQKVFEIGWRRFDEFMADGTNELWILRISENVCKYERRKYNRRQSLAQETGAMHLAGGEQVRAYMVQRGSTVEKQVIQREMNAALTEFVNTLPENLKVVFLMRLDHHTYDEIGYVLGITKQAARKRMLQALQHAGNRFDDMTNL
jgi:RNA polymerase sigma factor (sigma-70 family)